MTKNILHTTALVWQSTPFRFLAVGGSTVALFFALFFIFTNILGIWYILSTLLAYIIYYPTNFYLQKLWAFSNTDKANHKKQLYQHMSLTAVNIILNTVALYILVDGFGMYHIWAQALIIPVLSIFSFVYMRIIFR